MSMESAELRAKSAFADVGRGENQVDTGVVCWQAAIGKMPRDQVGDSGIGKARTLRSGIKNLALQVQKAGHVCGVVAIGGIDVFERRTAKTAEERIDQVDCRLAIGCFWSIRPVAVPNDIDRHVSMQDWPTVIIDAIALNHCAAAGLGLHNLWSG